jgi:RNA polymerase sigma-70 factor, ECF subfamily
VDRVETIDDAAVEALYAELERPVYNVVFRWVWDREEAREVVQEAFVRLWRMRARVEPATVRPLLYRIAVNLASNRRRWRRLRRVVALERAPAAAPAPSRAADEAMEREQRQAAVRSAVEALPERLRRVVTLCELAGLSYAEVAAILEIPAGTVASRRNAAMERLRSVLDDEAGGAAARRARVR